MMSLIVNRINETSFDTSGKVTGETDMLRAKSTVTT